MYALAAAVTHVAAIDIITPVRFVIDLVIWLACVGTELYALVHSIAQRSDAFTAAGKLSKPAWVAINAVALVVTAALGFGPTNGIFGIIAITAALVYIVDVRPAVREIGQGGSPW
jgi:hypothetical protein